MPPLVAYSCAPPQPRTPGHLHYIVLYYGRPLSLGFHRHLRDHPRQGASRRFSTGLYGPVAAGAPACPRPRPSLCSPRTSLAACGAHVARCVRPPMPKTPQDLSALPPCAYPRRRSAHRTSWWRGKCAGPLRLPVPPLRPGARPANRGSASVALPRVPPRSALGTPLNLIQKALFHLFTGLLGLLKLDFASSPGARR